MTNPDPDPDPDPDPGIGIGIGIDPDPDHRSAEPAESSAGRPVLPAPTVAARTLFGAELDGAQRYARRLATTGIEHGHLGPREVPRLWDRHLCNCAVLTELLPSGATIVDVGSGAGLPGIPMALRRPDLSVVLVEPMLRRSEFLEATVAELGLASRVQVVRGRAEDPAVVAAVGGSLWVTARAVAPLSTLLTWCLPLLTVGGRLLALKGSNAADEVRRATTEASAAVRGAIASVHVTELGRTLGMDPTQVVTVERSARVIARRRRS